jgi:hypothetical protein
MRISSHFQHPSQKLPRAVQVRLGCILRNVKQGGHFSHAGVQPIVQTQSGLVHLGQRSNAFRKILIALRSFRQRVRPRLGDDDMRKQRVIQVRISVAGPRLQVHGLVERDPVNPGAHFRFTPKRCQRMMDFQKHLLRHFFRLSRKALPQNGKSQPKYPVGMAVKQLRKGVRVATLRARHELGIAIHGMIDLSQRPASRFRKWKLSRPTPKKANGRGATHDPPAD